MSLSGDTQADVFEAFNLASRYLDDLLHILTILILKEGLVKFILPNSS